MDAPASTFVRPSVFWLRPGSKIALLVAGELSQCHLAICFNNKEDPERILGHWPTSGPISQHDSWMATAGMSAFDRATTSASGAEKVVRVCRLDCHTNNDALFDISSTNNTRIPLRLLPPPGAKDASR